MSNLTFSSERHEKARQRRRKSGSRQKTTDKLPCNQGFGPFCDLGASEKSKPLPCSCLSHLKGAKLVLTEQFLARYIV